MKKKTTRVNRPQKRTLIKKIRAIISEWGGFSTADVQATSSPVIKTLGKDSCQLAERFELYKVEAVIYVHENETDTDYIKYEDLDRDVLEEILYLAQDWDAISYKTEARCSN
jgi:hypothetical protein